MSLQSVDPTPESKAPCTTSDTGGLTPNTLTSMTLSISFSTATRMLEASRAFNSALKSSSVNDKNQVWQLAAESTNNRLLEGLLRDSKDEHLRLCLLLFLDMDKSRKLESAFMLLNGKSIDDTISGGSSALSLTKDQVQTLFQSLLFAISTCIQFRDNTKDASDGSNTSNDSRSWKLPETTRRSIAEIASYATSKLAEFCQRRFYHYPAPGSTKAMPPPPSLQKVSFHHFGEWYNSGGFSLVPWLELLDLAKWDHAGRAAARQFGSDHVGTTAATASYQQGYTGNASMPPPQSMHPQPYYAHPSKPDQTSQAPVYHSQGGAPLSHPPPQENTHQRPPAHPFNHIPSSKSRRFMPMPVTSSKEILLLVNGNNRCPHPIQISYENISIVDNLHHEFGFTTKAPKDVLKILMNVSTPRRNSSNEQGMDYFVSKMAFVSFFNSIRPASFAPTPIEGHWEQIMSLCFHIFALNTAEEVNTLELAVGLSLFCFGSKSSKLGETFEMMLTENERGMNAHKLRTYLRTYLRMFGVISLLSSSKDTVQSHLNALSTHTGSVSPNIKKIIDGANTGANLILDNLKSKSVNTNSVASNNDYQVSLTEFAEWYSNGGFSVAPWIEYLDLSKLFALSLKASSTVPIPSKAHSTPMPPINPPNASGKIRSFDDFMAGTPSPSLRHIQTPRSAHLSQRATPSSIMLMPPDPADVLFTFPLVKTRSLIVLREDAAYVRAVVDQLGLLLSEPDSVWSKLYNHTRKNPVPPLPVELAKLHKSGIGKRADANRVEFVNAILKSVPNRLRKKESDPPLPPTPEETLGNFFLSFDLEQVDRVPINQLMGGLTLFCGGKKSHKLSFAFSLFDMRKEEQKKNRKRKLDDVTSLSGKELFFFFQSFLIVMFSCCKQSLDLTAETVSRYIADTANMVTDDVMKFQWATRKMDRINFDEFGEWYNEGGFEIAPWLELLDLNKWVLLDKAKVVKLLADAKPMEAKRKNHLKDSSHRQNLPLTDPSPSKSHAISETFDVLPPTPADHLLDPTSYELFGDDIDIDAIGDFGFDFNDCGTNHAISVNDLPPPSTSKYNLPIHEQKPLNFKVVANEDTVYNVSIPSSRVQMIENIVNEHHLFNIYSDTLCQAIMSDKVGTSISKDKFMDIVKKFFKPSSSPRGQLLLTLLSTIFQEFDLNKCGKADAIELACGMTVLCGGRKSDKIEYAFEFLDKKKNGLVSRFAMSRYLRAFLVVLLQINSCELGDHTTESIFFDSSGHPVKTSVTIEQITEAVSSWVTDQVFKCTPKDKRTLEGGTECINFDNFAEWYTGGGYNNADWLELLDLKKWIKFSA